METTDMATVVAGYHTPSLMEDSHTLDLPPIPDAVLEKLVSDMDRIGYGVIENFVPTETVKQMREFVSVEMDRRGPGYLGFVGKDAVAGSVFARIGENPSFNGLMRRIYRLGTGRAAPASDLYQVLRCLAGESGKGHSLIFHYDSYVVTALLPVEIPNAERAGDLVMLPNFRRVRRLYLHNLVDKILLDNRVTQSLLRLLTRKRMLRLKRVKMIPGNAYFFWGYRSIHANEACDPAHTRATALFHFGNPHGSSQFGRRLRRLFPR